MKRWKLYFDGSCLPRNPGGHACYGYCLFSPDGKLFREDNGLVCSGEGATNNVAEFHALLAGVRFLYDEKMVIPLLCLGDSQLVVNMVSGKWKGKKPHLIELNSKCKGFLDTVSDDWLIEWIPREQNSHADRLSTSVPNLPRLQHKRK